MVNNPSIYRLLVDDPNDVLAALAYTTYKQHKIETMAAIESTTGHPPSADDFSAFDRAASTPSALAMYTRQAERLIQTFLQITLAERKVALEAEFTTTAISQQLDAIGNYQTAARGFMDWLREVGGNLIVSLLTILFIGALVIGYKSIEDWTGRISEKTGVTNSGASRAEPISPPQR